MRVAPEVQNTLVRLQDLVRQREYILSDPNIDAMEKTEKVSTTLKNIYFIHNFIFKNTINKLQDKIKSILHTRCL